MSFATVILMYAVWASLFAIGKISLALSTPAFITACRTLLAAPILLGYVAFRKKSSFRLKKEQWVLLVFIGFFSYYLTGTCEFFGLQYTSAAKASFIFNFAPLFSALLSYIHFKEKINKTKWIGLGIAFLGILPVLLIQTGSEEVFLSNFLSLPTLSVIASVLFSAYGWILLRKLLKGSDISPLLASGIGMLFGGGLSLLHSLYFDTWHPLPITDGNILSAAQWIIIMTILSNIICYNIYAVMLKKYTATFLSLIGLLTPLFASFIGWIFLGEPLSWTLFASSGIVSIGLLTVYYAEVKQGYIQKNQVTT
jgi:drug/metabolite transporter (DMT)-like permease